MFAGSGAELPDLCMQDEVLRRAVAYYGAKNWKRIGELQFLAVSSFIVVGIGRL